jgi:hypothetical protein
MIFLYMLAYHVCFAVLVGGCVVLALRTDPTAWFFVVLFIGVWIMGALAIRDSAE